LAGKEAQLNESGLLMLAFLQSHQL
jgi:hypothetical protein